MAFNLTNTQVHVIPHQHQTSDIPGLVELIQANAVVVSPTAPENPNAGKLWYNTTKGVFNIWNGSAWILVGPEICPLTKAQYDALSAADKADGRFYLITDNDGTIYVEWENIDGRPYLISSTAPSTPAEGYLWYDTTDDVLKFYNGTDWNPVNTNTEYTGGTNVSVDPVTHEISATDTTYVAGDFDIKDLADSTDLRTTWSGKQDAINDLQTIRSGAAAGATAVQPLDNVSGLTNDAGYITNAVSDLTNYYTKTQTYTKAEVDQMITDFGGFEVVEQLPAVATANPHIIYLLGPIGTGGDQYEEWIVTDVTTPGHFESASTVTDLTFNYSNTSDDFDFGGITNSYVGVKSITHSGDDINYTIFDENDSSSAPTYTNDTETPFVVKPDGDTEQWLMANPTGHTRNGSTYEGTLEVSYSASPLTWVSGSTTKTWTKIGETSVDLSNYFNTFTDTADSITAGSTNLFVTSSEKSAWNAKQDALVEGTGIDIDSSTNEISVDTTVIATKTDIANFFDKTSDDADDIDDTNSTNKFVTASEKSTWSGKQDALTAGDNISIDSNTNTISADVNTKTFPMAFATKVADAQAAIDWVLDGNNALINYDNRIYSLDKVENGVYYFKAVAYSNNGTNDTMTVTNIEVTVVSDEVTEVHIMGENHGYLETNRNYSTPFVPTQDGHPATKKYVDDNVIQKSAVEPSNPTEGTVWYDTTNDVLKVYNGSNWNVTGKTYTAGTNIDITNDVISADTQFVVVDTLPAVAQADENKVYILGPIGAGADKYEERVVKETNVPFTSASPITKEHIEATLSADYGEIVWNSDMSITNAYVGIDNYQTTNTANMFVNNYADSGVGEGEIDTDTQMPCVIKDSQDKDIFMEVPQAGAYGQVGEELSFDVYYSASPLSLATEPVKEWVKIGETSADLSNYLAKDNTTSYTPSGDYNPATKKYVDDRAVPTSGTTGYILTKTANGYEWAAAPSSGKYDIVTSSSEPSDNTVLWIKPGTSETSDEMYRYDDANSDWVLMGGVHKGADAPSEDFGREGGFWLKESQDGYKPELLYYDDNASGWVNVGGTFVSSSAPSYSSSFGKYGFWYDTSNNELKYYNHTADTWVSILGMGRADTTSGHQGSYFTTNSDGKIFYYEDDFGWNPIGGIIYSYSSSDVPTDKLWYDQTNDVFKYYNQSTADWEEVTKIYTPGDGIDIDTSNNNAISVDYSSVAASLAGNGLSAGSDDLNVDYFEVGTALAGTGLQLENISGGYQIGIDTTVVATKSDIANLGSFEVVDTLPAVGTASEKTIYLLGPIGTGADKYEEWIVTEDSQQQKQWTKIGETSIDLSGYATTSAMNAALLTKANVSDLNTKTFYLTGTTGAENIAAAQEAYDWYAAGKNPIIEYTPERSGIGNTTGLYFFSHYYNGNDLAFISGDLFDGESTSSGGRHISRRQLNIIADSSNVVTEIEKNTIIPVFNYLSTSSSNFNYTPSANYDPATKKYVDDNVVQKSSTAPSSYTEGTVWYDTTNDVLKVYNGSEWIEVGSGSGSGDMLYADFNWSAKSGASITLDLNTTIEPTANFTVNAPATIKDGQIYVLRVQTGVDAYTMTLGTNITNPYNEDLTLSINTIAQFSFLGINNKLELQPSIEAVDISGKQDKATSGSAAPSTTPSYVGQQYVDTTNGKLYVALGTSSSSDWMEVGAGGGNVVAITQQEYDALTPAEKNDGKFRIITDSPSETLPFVEEMDDSPTQGIKIWAGTQAQYNSLQSVDPSGVYIILSSN